MMRRIYLSAAFVMVAAPAFAAADDACKAPTAPTMPNGRTASREDVIAAANNVKAYVAESDKYQECLKGVIEGIDADYAKAEADAKAEKKPLAAKVKADFSKSKSDLVKKGETNQTTKEKLGASYAATAAAYRTAHPTPPAGR